MYKICPRTEDMLYPSSFIPTFGNHLIFSTGLGKYVLKILHVLMGPNIRKYHRIYLMIQHCDFSWVWL